MGSKDMPASAGKSSSDVSKAATPTGSRESGVMVSSSVATAWARDIPPIWTPSTVVLAGISLEEPSTMPR